MRALPAQDYRFCTSKFCSPKSAVLPTGKPTDPKLREQAKEGRRLRSLSVCTFLQQMGLARDGVTCRPNVG